MRHHNRFRRTSRLRKGYHRRQVDSFLDHVEVSLGGLFPPPTAADIRQAGFELVRHGYDVAEVDGYLDALEEKVITVQAATGGRRGRADPERDAAFLREELAAPYMKRFPRAGMLRRGYHVDDVDEFVDRALGALSGEGSLTLDDVRQVQFRPQRGGYREEAVDDALDRVVEHVLLVRRLGTPAPPVATTRLDPPAVQPAPPLGEPLPPAQPAS
jgi:DivIVA domain-containing protein